MEDHNHSHSIKNIIFKPSTPDITLTFSPEGIILNIEKHGQNGKVTTLDLTKLCITLFSEHFYKDKFNVFKSVFEDDLKVAIEKVLGLHSMRTSKKNHRKFSREIKERKKIRCGRIPSNGYTKLT